jgi:hypothetical protein
MTNPVQQLQNFAQTELLAQPSRLHQFMKNCGTAMGNLFHSLSQNHTALKTNVLVLSSLILVMSRIIISQASSKAAQGTPNEHFRYREAIRTFIREAAGWTLSFLLLRTIENVIRAGIRKAFGINLTAPASHLLKGAAKVIESHELKNVGILETFKKVGSQAKNLMLGRALPAIEKEAGTYYANSHFHFNEKNEFYQIFKGFIGLFSPSRHVSPTEQMKNFYEWFPILMGSIPAIGMSGYALERFNLDYSQPIIDALAARKKKQASLSMSSTLNLPSVPQPLHGSFQPPTQSVLPATSSPLKRPGFNQYVQRIQMGQLERQTF